MIKSKKITTFPSAGRESKSVTIRTFISLKELIDLSGLMIRTILIADTLAEINSEIIPVITTMKSIKFHPSLRYVCLSKMKPIAMTLSMNSRINMEVKR